MEPKYKVGDIVTIKKREGQSIDYNFTFVDGMAKLAGQQFKVIRISMGLMSGRKIPDDGFRYSLDCPGNYIWASSMFEDSADRLTKNSIVSTSLSTSDDKSGDISPFIKRKGYPELDFSL